MVLQTRDNIPEEIYSFVPINIIYDETLGKRYRR